MSKHSSGCETSECRFRRANSPGSKELHRPDAEEAEGGEEAVIG
jgi:hypothetical protein